MKSSKRTASSLKPRRTRADDTERDAQSAASTVSTKPNDASPLKLKVVASPGTATTLDADSTVARLPTLSLQHAQALEARSLDPEVCVRLGFHTAKAKFRGRDGLAIPIIRNKRVLFCKYRGPRKADGSKQIISDDREGVPHAFWNEDALRDQSLSRLPVVIAEGEMDGAAAVQVADGAFRSVAVTDGANSNLDFFDDIGELLKTVPRFILGGHGDDAGRKLNQELARRLGAARCGWIDYPQGAKDINEVLEQHGPAVARDLIKNARPYPIKGLYRLSDFPEMHLEVRDTGWPNLNTYLKLWLPELFVCTGIPQHGKSKFMLHMLMQQAEQYGAKAAIFSAEVPIKPHVRSEMRKFYCGGGAGRTPEEADEWIEEHFVFINADPRDVEEAADIPWIIDKASDAVIRYGIQWLFIDPWNQVEHQRGKDSIDEYQEKMLKQLNIFRRSFECGVMIAAHPTKGVLNQQTGKLRVPTLYDISGSSHWYNAPDHGIVVDRPNSAGNEVRILVRKSRFMQSGVCGEAWLRYDNDSGRYVPLIDPPTNNGSD